METLQNIKTRLEALAKSAAERVEYWSGRVETDRLPADVDLLHDAEERADQLQRAVDEARLQLHLLTLKLEILDIAEASMNEAEDAVNATTADYAVTTEHQHGEPHTEIVSACNADEACVRFMREEGHDVTGVQTAADVFRAYADRGVVLKYELLLKH